MTARLLAVALAFAITGAPVAMCEAACATRSADALHGGHGERHSCHENASSNQLAIAAIPHDCGHSDDNDQLGTDNGTRVLTPPIVLASAVTLVLPVIDVAAASGVGAISHSPPGPLALSTQLRI